MKLFRSMLILGLIMVLAVPAVGDFIGKDDQEIKTAAEPLLDNILAGISEGNFQKYAKDFDDTMKKAVTEERFKQVNSQIAEKLGKYQSRTYLGSLKQKNMTVALWKAKFEKSEDDVLIKLVVSKRQDKIFVAGLWFQ